MYVISLYLKLGCFSHQSLSAWNVVSCMFSFALNIKFVVGIYGKVFVLLLLELHQSDHILCIVIAFSLVNVCHVNIMVSVSELNMHSIT